MSLSLFFVYPLYRFISSSYVSLYSYAMWKHNTSAYVDPNVLKALAVNGTIIWDVPPSSPVDRYRRFGRTYRLTLLSQHEGSTSIQNVSKGLTDETTPHPKKLHSSADAFFLLVTCLAYFFTLKMEAVRSSQTSVNFYRTTLRHIPEDLLIRVWHTVVLSYQCFGGIYFLHLQGWRSQHLPPEIAENNEKFHSSYHDWSLLWFSSVPPGEYSGTASTQPRPLPSKLFPIHYLRIMVWDTDSTVKLTTSKRCDRFQHSSQRSKHFLCLANSAKCGS
jgi:hypothetical protein